MYTALSQAKPFNRLEKSYHFVHVWALIVRHILRSENAQYYREESPTTMIKFLPLDF